MASRPLLLLSIALLCTYIHTYASVCTYVCICMYIRTKYERHSQSRASEVSRKSQYLHIAFPPLPSPAGHHHAGLLSCSSESSLHTLHRRKGGGDTATQSTPDLGSLARKSGSAATGKPPLQPKKVQPVEGGSPKVSSKGARIDGNQVSELP